MAVIFAREALLPAGWAKGVRMWIEEGLVCAVETGVAAAHADERHDAIVPGTANLHSHAFQRAMAGLAETRGSGSDSFWSWREAMYRFALEMTPEQVEAVAAQLYMEMLEAGFTRVGEFHYLHHDNDGHPYADVAEMAARIASAASATGIGLTLLPVFYAHAGFGGVAPGEGQRRFVNDRETYARLLARCRELTARLPGWVTGVAPHSLRAVTPEQLADVVAMAEGGPIHIHIAEQVKEVEDCLAWSGMRPVEWLLDNAPVDRRWCLIHATHMTGAETRAVAATGAIAGLCPITEANLGDGTFPAAEYIAEGGRYGVGSDSNVLIGLGDELRQLEYSQRLTHRARNVLAAPGASTGRALFDGVVHGGAAALGADCGIEAGKPADLVSLRPRYGLPICGDGLLDSLIFAAGVDIDCVWVRGRKLVKDGRHFDRDAITRNFSEAMRALLA